MIEPSGIPQFVGNLDQLEKDVSALRSDAIGVRNGGKDVHSRFQALAGVYKAPEDTQLFDTTRPVMDKAEAFATKLETVADALDTFSIEARPLAKQLAQLKADALAFVDSVAGDDDWTYDEDKIDRHQKLIDGVSAAESAFRDAERRAASKISALVGGPRFVVDDGSHTVNDKSVMYGYGLEALKHAKELPWGTPESESHHAWEVGYWAKSYVWDGLVVDNIWGGIKGLGTLVGIGPEDTSDAWGHIWDMVGGIGQYTAKPYDWVMDHTIGPDEESADELRQKHAAKDFGKGLVAWDMWGENPARASATVTFNLLTLGAGPAAMAAKGGEAGALAKAAGTASKVGTYLDPLSAGLTVGGKAISALPKLSEVTAGIRNVFDTTASSQRLHSVIELPDGSKVLIKDGKFIPVNAEGKVNTTAPHQEKPPVERTGPEEVPSQREPALVGAGARAPEDPAPAGGNLPPQASHDAATRGGGSHTPRGPGEASGRVGAAHAVGSETPRSGAGTVGNGHAGTGSGSHGRGGLDDLGRTGDDATGDGVDGATGPDSDIAGGHTEVQRPSFIREGANPYGPRGSLTLKQIEEIQLYRANHEPGYFERYYRKDGTRRSLEIHDESGFTPPQLTRLSDDAPLIRARDVPAPPKPHFLDDEYISVGADTVKSKARLRVLEEAAQTRHFAVEWDNKVADWKAETGRAHEIQGTVDSAAQWGEARGTYKESHTAMGEATEKFGEKAAEHHYIAERYADFEKETLLGPKNGNDQFDQVWKHEDGRVVVIEAKSSPGTELGRRTLPDGRQVSQGSREYFSDILAAMEKRGEFELVDSLEKALKEGKLEYVVVKGERNTGTYTGYQYRRFDISKGTLP
ncbi:hypothetical protein ACFWDI_24770 [Streptomyces sp. NPDC060064]|uniref:hypothetical protein n=2 Tax=unclassified Streptomyces TaxID=2593676 RepID=UPI0036B9EC74